MKRSTRCGPPMLLIADPERAIGLAGVMGGANSAMTDTTTDVLLESATFNAINTRRTAAALWLRSEASLRFEKGLEPELAMRAVRRATALVLETAGGGRAARGVADVFLGSAEPRPIRFTHGRLRQSLGVDFPHDRVVQVPHLPGLPVWSRRRLAGGAECDPTLLAKRCRPGGRCGRGGSRVSSDTIRCPVSAPWRRAQPHSSAGKGPPGASEDAPGGGRTSGDHLLQPGESCHPRPRPSPRPWQT